MVYSSYQKIIGTIQSIRSGNSCCTQMISVRTESEMVDFVVSQDTEVIDNVRLRRGMRIAAFYDTNLPAPAVFPPQYQAELNYVFAAEIQEVTLKYFDENLTAEDDSLKLNLSPLTNIETRGQRFFCSSRKCRSVGLLYEYYLQSSASDDSPENHRDVPYRVKQR